jgi:capsular exopolysaccharide synthesis family protein
MLTCITRGNPATTILVTSPGPMEGKTTLVDNLGMAMAESGQRTIIVNADLRKHTPHLTFSKNGDGEGLMEVLMGTAALSGCVRATNIPGLDVLGSGRADGNASQLLSGRTFAGVLEQLKGHYECILIDSPPVTAFADAQILATLSDLTLFVLREGETSRILAQRARDALLAVGARVVGAVVNDVPPSGRGFGYYSGYDHYYSSVGSSGNGHESTTNGEGRAESPAAPPQESPSRVDAPLVYPIQQIESPGRRNGRNPCNGSQHEKRDADPGGTPHAGDGPSTPPPTE